MRSNAMELSQFLLLFQCVGIAFPSNISKKDPRYNNLIASTIPSHTTSCRSRIDCYIRCMKEDCPSYFYNTLDKRCQINIGIVDIYTPLNELGWQLFRVPVDGQWTVWSSWTSFTTCSKTCGGGYQFRDRSRECTDPPPQNGGLPCHGASLETETQQCQTQLCPIDGGWTTWGPWSSYDTCTKTCDTGSQASNRERDCSNPLPQHNGALCTGQNSQQRTRECNTNTCPTNCPVDYEEHASVGICFKYYRSNYGKSYSQKTQRCESDGGSLAKVDTLLKHNAIVQHLQTMSHNEFVVIQGEFSNGYFRYDDGTVLTYTHWDWGQPEDENFISINYQQFYRWHDITYQMSSSDFICEVPM